MRFDPAYQNELRRITTADPWLAITCRYEKQYGIPLIRDIRSNLPDPTGWITEPRKAP